MIKKGDKVRIIGPAKENGDWYAGGTDPMRRAHIAGKTHEVTNIISYRRDNDCATISGLTEWFGVCELKKVTKPLIIIGA